MFLRFLLTCSYTVATTTTRPTSPDLTARPINLPPTAQAPSDPSARHHHHRRRHMFFSTRALPLRPTQQPPLLLPAPPPPPPSLYVLTAECVLAAQRHIDPSAVRVKLMKRGRKDRSATHVYSARVVDEKGRVLAMTEGWYGTKEEVVERLVRRIEEEGRGRAV